MYPCYLCHFSAETDFKPRSCSSCGLVSASHEKSLQKKKRKKKVQRGTCTGRNAMHRTYQRPRPVVATETRAKREEEKRFREKYGSRLYRLPNVICSMMNSQSRCRIGIFYLFIFCRDTVTVKLHTSLNSGFRLVRRHWIYF